MRVLELYSGIGGMHYALNESKVEGKIVLAIDINTNANSTYQLNFPKTPNKSRNIQSLTKAEIEKLDIDTILMSPPCQPFSRNGLKKDLQDSRSCSFSHILDLIPHLSKLEKIFIENVQGFENSTAQKALISTLKKSNYNYKEFLLSPCQFGIPNSRQRYYLIAKKNHLNFVFENSELESCIPEKILQALPENRHRLLAEKENPGNSGDSRVCYTLKNVIENNVDEKFLVPLKILKKRVNIFDIRTENSRGSCCVTKGYFHYVEGTGSIYCPKSEKEILEVFEKLGGEKEIPDEKMEIMENLGLRYFTPKEISKLMCFPESFEFPENMTEKQKYRLLGNSINVYVVSLLIYLLNCENS